MANASVFIVGYRKEYRQTEHRTKKIQQEINSETNSVFIVNITNPIYNNLIAKTIMNRLVLGLLISNYRNLDSQSLNL